MEQEVKKFELTEGKKLVVETKDGRTVCYLEDIFKPKDGDFIFVKDNDCDYVFVFIFSHIDSSLEINNVFYHAMMSDEIYINSRIANLERWNIARMATESERQQLIDKLASEGYEWDANKKDVVKLEWRPILSQTYYIPAITSPKFYAKLDFFDNELDEILINRKLACKTPEEAIAKAKQMLGIEQ